MPVAEGVAHLVDELEHGVQETEVLLIDQFRNRTEVGNRPAPQTIRAVADRQAHLATAPLLGGVVRCEGHEQIEVEVAFNPHRAPYLTQHRYHGVAILPSVIAIESLLETAGLLTDRAPCGLTQVEIRSALRFYAGKTETCRVRGKALLADAVNCQLVGEFRNRDGTLTEPSRCFVEGIVHFGAEPVKPSVVWAEPPSDGWRAMRFDDERTRSEHNLVWHGPVFQDLRRLTGRGETLWGEIIAPALDQLAPDAQPGAAWCSPPAALDACLQACGILSWHRDKTYYLPWGFQQIGLVAAPMPGEVLMVVVQLREQLADRAIFDFSLYGADRRLLISVQGFRGVKVSSASSEDDE
jgi:hypothetical protein